MSTKRYFNILGIPPTRNEKIIKRAYRKKAMKYHPDRNSSAAAKDKFIQVTQAYDRILLALEQANNPRDSTRDTTQRQTTSRQTYTRQTQRSTNTTEREERVKEAQQRYDNMKRKEAEENERYYRNITTGKKWRKFKIIMYVCTVFSLLITLDTMVFPTETQESQIVKKDIKSVYRGSNNLKTSPVVFENGQKAWVAGQFIEMAENEYVYLERTAFFKDIKYVKTWKYNEWYVYTPDYSLMSTFPLIPLILMIPLLTFFIKAKTIYFTLLYHMSIKFMPFFFLFVVISNDRWAHLITLGLIS